MKALSISAAEPPFPAISIFRPIFKAVIIWLPAFSAYIIKFLSDNSFSLVSTDLSIDFKIAIDRS
ncbi:MAG: hypothetical protein Q8Q89_01545 [bacterium]|nr:hypothetical protein [bacterium]